MSASQATDHYHCLHLHTASHEVHTSAHRGGGSQKNAIETMDLRSKQQVMWQSTSVRVRDTSICNGGERDTIPQKGGERGNISQNET